MCLKSLSMMFSLLFDFSLSEIFSANIPSPLLSKYLKKVCRTCNAFEFHDSSDITNVYYEQLASWMNALQSALSGTSAQALLNAMDHLQCGLNRFVGLTMEEQRQLTELTKSLCSLFFAVKGTATATALSEACKEEKTFLPSMIGLVTGLLSLYPLNQDMTELFEGDVWNVLAQCSASLVEFPSLCFCC